MSELITAVDTPVRPDYHMFGITDRVSVGEMTPTPGTGWLGVGTTGVLISVGEQLVSPSLRLEIWDGPPPEGPRDHEVRQTVRLLLPTGELGVDQITGGWADVLPSVPPGRYQARITGWDRERTRREFMELPYDRGSPEFEAASAALEGQERYLVQLWLETSTATLVDSIALAIHAGYPLLAVADEGTAFTAPLPAVGSHWLSAGRDVVLVQLADQEIRSSLRFELWDGPPPDNTDEDPRELDLHVPSGALTVMHLRSPAADRNERVGGAIPLFTVPPGDYHVRVRTESPARRRYLAQFWPA